MNEFYGKKTEHKDANGLSIYEYDRINYKGVYGTVLNVGDVKHPIWAVMKDRKKWETASKFVKLADVAKDCVVLKSSDVHFQIFPTLDEFADYCYKNDWHQYKECANA